MQERIAFIMALCIAIQRPFLRGYRIWMLLASLQEVFNFIMAQCILHHRFFPRANYKVISAYRIESTIRVHRLDLGSPLFFLHHISSRFSSILTCVVHELDMYHVWKKYFSLSPCALFLTINCLVGYAI